MFCVSRHLPQHSVPMGGRHAAFSLVELLMVVVVVAILSGLGIFMLGGSRRADSLIRWSAGEIASTLEQFAAIQIGGLTRKVSIYRP